jgi:signal transduction histidine kinase
MSSSLLTVDSMSAAAVILASLTRPKCVVDDSLRITMVNPAFCTFMEATARALEGKTIDELIADGPQLRTMLQRVAEEGLEIDELEVRCTTPPHEQKVLCLSARRLPLRPLDSALVLVELRDITLQRESKREKERIHIALQRDSADLERANQELDAFTFSISHDLRSPLRLLNRIAHTLLENYGDAIPTGAQDLVKIILASTEEMGELTSNLLRFSQVNREPMTRKPVKIKAIVRESIAELQEEQRGRNVQFVIDEMAPCHGNRALLKQLMLNLLQNALKFTRECESPAIHVGCRQTDNGPVYFVRDNGLGFDPSESGSMFLVFQRLHKAHKVEGSGVGLAIAKRIVERHDGRIWAEGEPGRGATFYFTLGAASEEFHTPKGGANT